MSQLRTTNPELTVPRYVRRGLEKLAGLTKESTQELLSVLKEEKASLSGSSMLQRIAARIEEAEGLNDIIYMLLSIYRARQEYGLSTDTLVERMSSDIEELGLSQDQQGQLKERLLEFLSIKSLAVTAKAANVMTSHERIFRKARILTDVRPIFEEDDSGHPAAAVVIHMLKITYQQNDGDAHFFVALDTEDVRKLRDVLNRADKKAANLQSLLEATNVPYLEVRSAESND